jgi:hypothetical protein
MSDALAARAASTVAAAVAATEPIERIEPSLAMERIESRDPSESSEAMGGLYALCTTSVTDLREAYLSCKSAFTLAATAIRCLLGTRSTNSGVGGSP